MNRLIAAHIILLLLISAQVHASLAASSENQSWRFRVFLDDSPIGYHHFKLKRDGDVQRLHINAEFDVSLFFINVYSYRHDNTETWEGGCLQRLSSETNDDGTIEKVDLKKQNNDLLITSTSGDRQLQGCIRSFAYWNPQLLKSDRLLNAQTGELVDVSFTKIGTQSVSIENRTVEAIAYQLSGEDIDIRLWYSTDGHWLGLQSETSDGYTLRYALMEDSLQ